MNQTSKSLSFSLSPLCWQLDDNTCSDAPPLPLQLQQLVLQTTATIEMPVVSAFLHYKQTKYPNDVGVYASECKSHSVTATTTPSGRNVFVSRLLAVFEFMGDLHVRAAMKDMLVIGYSVLD